MRRRVSSAEEGRDDRGECQQRVHPPGASPLLPISSQVETFRKSTARFWPWLQVQIFKTFELFNPKTAELFRLAVGGCGGGGGLERDSHPGCRPRPEDWATAGCKPRAHVSGGARAEEGAGDQAAHLEQEGATRTTTLQKCAAVPRRARI